MPLKKTKVPRFNHSGRLTGLFGIVRDLNAYKRAAEVQAVQLRLIRYAADHTVMEFLQKFLDEAEVLTKSEIGFFHFLEEDQTSLTLQAWSTNTKAKMCTAEGSGRHYPVSQAGVWVDCVRARRPVVHNDYANLAHKKGLPEGHATVIRELVVPVFRGERIVAILGIGNKRTDYGKHDVNVVQQLADLAWETVTHKRAAEALRTSEERFRGLVESSSDWIWEVNARGIYTYASPKVEEILGYRPEEVVGKRPLDLMPPDEIGRIAGILDDLIERRRPIVAQENVNLHKDGRQIVLETSGVPIFDEMGRVCGYRGVDRDITERKRSEEKICKMNEVLEHRVAKRTAELAQRTQQLQQLALEVSDAEDRERRHIASILHDDFQQRLAYIKIELDIIRKQHGDEKANQKLEHLGQLLEECIEDSRNLSYEINPPALHRGGLVTALELLIGDMREKHGLLVEAEIQSSAEPDSFTLKSILYRSIRELLFNVIKHAGVDSAVLEVRHNDEMIQIRVEDFGKGFDAYMVRSKQGRGFGFGLYNVEDRVTFVGGGMKIKTAPGKGCCIVLTVPKSVSQRAVATGAPLSHAEEEASMGVAPSEVSQILGDGDQIRILLADDHELIREALAKMLHGCKELTVVGQATDGHEVVQLAAKLKPDVILMDVAMPKIDGFEATAQITGSLPDIRIIGLSMHNDVDTRQKMLAAGASAYLTKTGSPDILVDTIRQIYFGNVRIEGLKAQDGAFLSQVDPNTP
jgi:PAS domain S-box-containing protein